MASGDKVVKVGAKAVIKGAGLLLKFLWQLLLPILMPIIIIAIIIISMFSSAQKVSAEEGTSFSDSSSINSNGGNTFGSVKGTRENIYKASCNGLCYKTFLQNPKDGAGWSHDRGCWATANAVILSAFGWEGTPNQLPTWPWGSSSNYSLAGLKSATVFDVTVNGIKNCLDNGCGIHIRVEGGKTLTTYNGSNAFSGHSLNILDYRKNGNKYEFYVHDPYDIDTTFGWGDAQTIVNALDWYEYVKK